MKTWIGLAGVGSLPGSTALGEAKGAYVNALARALDEKQYKEAVQSALESLGLFAFEFEDVEPFDTRANRRQLDDELYQLADEVQRCGKVCFGDFHTYASLDS